VVGLGELARDSTPYVRTDASFRLGAQQELPGRLDPGGCLVLGGAESPVHHEPVTKARSPAPDHTRPEERRTSAHRRDLRTPFLRHLPRRGAGDEHQEGRGDDEGGVPGHALK